MRFSQKFQRLSDKSVPKAQNPRAGSPDSSELLMTKMLPLSFAFPMPPPAFQGGVLFAIVRISAVGILSMLLILLMFP